MSIPLRILAMVLPVTAAALLLILPRASQADAVEDTRLWLNVTAQGRVAAKGEPLENWRLSMEVQPRWRESGKDFDTLILRPAVGYVLNERMTVWLGYGHIFTHPAPGRTVDENRLFQQLVWAGPTPLGALNSRTRLEQRWLETGDDVGWRLRQMAKFSWPISAGSPTSFIASDEVFVNLNGTDWGARDGFDQNRGFAGLGHTFNPSARIEVGYLNQYVRRRGRDAMNHVLSTGVFLSF